MWSGNNNNNEFSISLYLAASLVIMGLKATTFIRHGIVSAIRCAAYTTTKVQYMHKTIPVYTIHFLWWIIAQQVKLFAMCDAVQAGDGKHFNYYERKLRWRFYWNENCRCTLAMRRGVCLNARDCSMFDTFIISAFIINTFCLYSLNYYIETNVNVHG